MTATYVRLVVCGLPALLHGVPAAAQIANAHLQNTEGEDVGVVAFAPLAAGGVHITVSAIGLPQGIRGFHVHEVGECDPSDGFKSAGDHFNPTDAAHGWNSPDGPHAGDLPNLHVNEDGTVAVEFFHPHLTLDEGTEASLIGGNGTAIVVHEHADDYSSQPSGEAGNRIVCGVVTLE